MVMLLGASWLGGLCWQPDLLGRFLSASGPELSPSPFKFKCANFSSSRFSWPMPVSIRA